MSSVCRKFLRKQGLEKEKYYKDVKSEATKIASKALDRVTNAAYEEAANDAIAKVMAVTAEIIYNDFGKLKNKDTRLSVYVELLTKKLQLVEQPTEKQLEVEKLLYEQCGVKIGR